MTQGTSQETVTKYSFGFLPYRHLIEFDGGSISPVSNYEGIKALVEEDTHEDGFLYPLLTWRVSKSGKEIPHTKRPEHLYRVTASHDLRLSFSGATEDLRRGPGAFVIHLLAYIFGVRLQFHDWWFDGRVPVRCTHNIHFTDIVKEDFLSHSYQIWRNWPEQERKLITNVLYMHSRAPSYEWDWERFVIEYTVLDGCYKLAELRYGISAQHHKDRIKALSTPFGIPLEEQVVDRIVRLRNSLFHETLWDGSQPCTTVSDFAFEAAGHLRRLNQRLIPALLGYNTPYSHTHWWSLSACTFDKQ